MTWKCLNITNTFSPSADLRWVYLLNPVNLVDSAAGRGPRGAVGDPDWVWCHLFLLLNWSLPLSAFHCVWRSKATLARAALITSSARGRCMCMCVCVCLCGVGCVVRICKGLLAFPKIARLTFLLTLMLIIPHKFPKANWYFTCACLWVCVHVRTGVCVRVYQQGAGSNQINVISVYLWKCSSLKSKQVSMFFFNEIQNPGEHQGLFLKFTFFDPHDFPMDKLQLKGVTSQFKRHFNVAFIYGQA